MIDINKLCQLTREQSNQLYLSVMQDNDIKAMKQLCLGDLFFLLTVGFKRKDINTDWLYDRCREVQKNPDGYLDLWAREHYKSTIITYGLTIQDILNNPEITVGIFSHTKSIAKKFLEQIKKELEDNTFLQDLFPDILYKEPKKQSPVWSSDKGIQIKRKTNPKELTVEANGLVDGQPTGAHYSLLIYDDVVTKESVNTPEQIKNVTDSWALSLNLGAHGGRVRYIGTRYHYNDTWKTIIDRESAIPRIYPATDSGTIEGNPVFLDYKTLMKKRRDMGPYVFACQMLQNPKEDSVMGFSVEWLKFYDKIDSLNGWNIYIHVDPASKKKKANDYTVQLVIATAPDGNRYLIDGVRDRLNLTERTNQLFEFVYKYTINNVSPKVVYEEYGLQADIEHIEYEMEIRNYRFSIVAIGGAAAKEDRIRKLVPVFEQGRFWLPHRLMFVTRERKVEDLIQIFLTQEYEAFPVSVHDDIFDTMARNVDPKAGIRFPDPITPQYQSITQGRQDLPQADTSYDPFAN